MQNNNQIQILKAKIVTPKGKNKEGWHLEAVYCEVTKDGPITQKVESQINPHGDLLFAFSKLNAHIARLTDQYNAEGQLDTLSIEARGYSMKGDDDKEGITITGQRKISNNRSITLNTPFLKWESGEDAYEKIADLNKDIDACSNEVYQYLFKGKHAKGAQMDMFDQESHLDEQAPNAYSNITNVFIWAKAKDNTLFLPRGMYDDGLVDKIKAKVIEQGGEPREDNERIFDFKESPVEVLKKLSKGKNKYIELAVA